MNRLVCIILICIFSVNGINAQELSFKKYTTANGLPQTQVMRTIQDSKGFLWIVTKHGISQFDGIEFINYTKEDGLPDSKVIDVLEDSEGVIWVLSKSGISKFNGNHFIFYPPQDTFQSNDLGKNLVFFNHRLWFCDDHQNNRDLISFKDGIYTNHSKNNLLIDSLSILNYRVSKNQDGILIGTENKIYRWNDNMLEDLTPDYSIDNLASLSRFYNNYNLIYQPLKELLDLENLETFAQDNILISGGYHRQRNGCVYIINPRTIAKLKWEHEHFNNSFIDRDSIMWVSSEGGLFKYYSDAFLNFTPAHGLNENIWSVVEDDIGNIWFASFTKGLQMYDGGKMYDRNEIFDVRNEALYVGATKLSNGTLYFPSNSGVIKWEDNQFSDVEWVRGQTEIVFENSVNKEIMVGTVQGLFYNQNGIIKQYKNLIPGKDGYVMGISYDQKGYYWFVTSKTVLRFKDNDFYYFDQEKVPIKDGFTTDVDSTGNVWLGGFEGLFYYSYAKDSFIHVLPGALNDVVKFIKVMNKDQLLVGRINDLVIIDLNKLFNNEKFYYRIIDKNEGYLGHECRQNGILKDSKGFYWINTTNSVVRFDPEKLDKNEKSPLVYLQSVDILDDSLQWKQIKFINNYDDKPDDTLFLNHHNNTFRISYTAISTRNPEGVNYQYRLLGHQNEWSSPTNERMIEFQDISPGHYTFQLYASNSIGVRTEKPAELVVIIKPAFWQTLIFKILIVFILTFIVIFMTLLYLKKKHRKKERLKENQRYYTKLHLNQLIKQFDPHFTFNVVSSIGAHIMNDNKEIAYDYLLKLSDLLRAVLQDHDVFTKTVEEEITFLRNYCEIQKFRLTDKFTYFIEVEEGIDKNYKIPKMLLQNFVENSIKHGISNNPEGGHVIISIVKNHAEIIASIKDNGIGRKAAKNNNNYGTHQGQKITSDLFRLINKLTKKEIKYEIIDLYEDNGQPVGTEVKIYFPIDGML